MQNTLNSWDDVTLDIARKMQRIQGDVIDRDVQLVSLVYNIDTTDVWKMSVPEMATYTNKLGWVYETPATKTLDEIIFRGERFVPCLTPDEISYAQYVDYQSYIKETDKNRGEIIASMFKPEKGEYNKGYNMKAFIEHIYQTVTLPEFRGFFLLWQTRLTSSTDSSLTWLRWLRMTQPRRMRKQMDSLMKEVRTLLYGLGLSNQ